MWPHGPNFASGTVLLAEGDIDCINAFKPTGVRHRVYQTKPKKLTSETNLLRLARSTEGILIK